MNGQTSCDQSQRCYFHPREIVVGVCSLCLKERLAVLASKRDKDRQRIKEKKSCRGFPKIPWRCDHGEDKDYETASTIHEGSDSFISIKFGDNGVALWENSKVCEFSDEKKCSMPWFEDDHCSMSKDRSIRAVIEQSKPMRWSERIFQILQFVRPSIACHAVTKRKGVKGTSGIRNLSKML